MRHIVFKIAPVLLLASCTSHLQELKQLEPKATDFTSSLAVEYLAYSESEAEQGERRAAEHFAEKGLKAARGEVVLPDDAGTDSNIADSRAALIDMLAGDIKNTEFLKTARAQLLFDCWNQQENYQMLDGDAPCAEEFEQVYTELQEMIDSIIYGANRETSVNFLPGSAALDDEEKSEIKKTVTHLGSKPYIIEIKGYYEAVDKGAIARKRLASVRAELIRAGVPRSKLIVAKLVPVVKTGKEVVLSSDKDEQDNDKVDIIITSSKHAPGGSND